MDQFDFEEHCNITMALIIKCQHNWLGCRLDGEGVMVIRVLSFDFGKAFDTVSYKTVCEKLKSINLCQFIRHELDYQFPWKS